MKKTEVETYRFIGDSTVDRAKIIIDRHEEGICTQTEIIRVINANKRFIKGGSSFCPEDSKRATFLINFGSDKKEPEQVIKVVMDSENLTNGDPNALAVQNLCDHAIKIKHKNMRHKVIQTGAGILALVGLEGALIAGFMYADQKETEAQSQKMSSYLQELEEERMKNGQFPSDIIDFDDDNNPVIDEDSLARSK